MYFKQIELVGFKSFADRTIIRLEPGVTAVVGPNGCGKSNILDAVRWALGEQRAKALRGGHMQDVIFNGTDERAPTAMAEVSLTFDNTDSRLPVDFAEVQVTRRIYRSGESEYLLNNAPCRLRDVQELFMDTGIGTNAYSLIGQGKIDMVLSSKPEDRRFLFEEAAGIIKYKSRKRIAMRRLDSAHQNLLRLGDIVAEVERQCRSLKRQVNAAIRYRELSESLRDFEIRGVWLKYKQVTTAIAETRKSFDGAQALYEEASTETTRLEARHEEIGLSKLEIDRVLLARREGVHDLDTEMEKIERQVALLRQQINFCQKQSKQAAADKDALETRAADLAENRSGASRRAAELRAEKADVEAILEDKERNAERLRREVEEAEAKVETVRAQAAEHSNRRTKNEMDIERHGVTLGDIEKQLEAVYGRQEAANQKSEDHLERLEALRLKEREGQGHLSALENESARSVEEEHILDGKRQDLIADLQKRREEKSRAEARLHSLRELRDAYEGYAVGVRAVMSAVSDNRSEMQGVLGPAADLISTEPRYERAIEAALGASANAVVVRTAQNAKAAVAFLTENQGGRVTFLPLDTIKFNPLLPAPAYVNQVSVLARAVDVVRFDVPNRKAIEHLLGNTLLVSTLEDALAIAQGQHDHPPLVTLQGEVVSPSGALTGGRTPLESRGLIGRSAEIDELQSSLNVQESEVQTLGGEVEGLTQQIAAAKAKQNEVAEKIAGCRTNLSETGVEIARHTTDVENLSQANAALEQERNALCLRRDDFEAERAHLEDAAGAIKTDEERMYQALADTETEASRARQDLSVNGGEVADLRVSHAGLSQHAEEAQRDLDRLEAEHEMASDEVRRREELIAELSENEGRLENETAQDLERSKALSESKEEARKKVIEAENNRQTLLDESDALEKSLHETREKSRVARSEVHQFELSLRHDEDQRNFFEERILTEYHITLSSLSEGDVGEDDLDEEIRDENITQMREKLERMGQVNIGAIDEYEELEQRREFLIAQHEDLQKASETLLSVVTRIDKTIREMFLETFAEVSEHFRQHFRRLFNGGQARVYLLDEDDPLESGIEIEARPPGKKPQTITLLSGGEQAMTAIALLFSIFKAKPSPFCVLDEVDAPLDDANIGRFLSLLEEFTSQSQFIIITHNKRTMTRADALYGITMEERGVSKLVSVRFDEARGAESAA